MNIIPASRSDTFNGFKIVATFNVDTQLWDWIATKMVKLEVCYSGTAKDSSNCFGAAKRKIAQKWPMT